MTNSDLLPLLQNEFNTKSHLQENFILNRKLNQRSFGFSFCGIAPRPYSSRKQAASNFHHSDPNTHAVSVFSSLAKFLHGNSTRGMVALGDQSDQQMRGTGYSISDAISDPTIAIQHPGCRLCDDVFWYRRARGRICRRTADRPGRQFSGTVFQSFAEWRRFADIATGARISMDVRGHLFHGIGIGNVSPGQLGCYCQFLHPRNAHPVYFPVPDVC